MKAEKDQGKLTNEQITAETLSLFERFKNTGDRTLLDEIVKLNKGLVFKMSKKYELHCDRRDWDDLPQAGFLGLIKAVKGFDHTKGEFCIFACICIRNEIIDFLGESLGPIKAPQREVHEIGVINRAEEVIWQQSQIDPDTPQGTQETAQITGINIERVHMLRALRDKKFLSLNQSYDETGETLEERIADPKTKNFPRVADARMDIQRATNTDVTKNQKKAIGLYYFDYEDNPGEAIRKSGLTKQGLNKTVHRALRNLANSPTLKGYENGI